MNYQEILESGLIEMYIIGDISPNEVQIVEDALEKYPELRQYKYEREKTLEFYSKIHAIEPPTGTLNTILHNLAKSSVSQKIPEPYVKRGGGWSSILLGVTLLGLAAGGWFVYQQSDELSRMEMQLQKCNQEQASLQENMKVFALLNDRDSKVVPIESTEKFAQTEIVLYDNQVLQKAFIKIQNLPQISSNESFQLWSLKGTDNPIPLDVFDSQSHALLEIQHVGGSNAYAITVEKKGGAQTPNLDKLVGVFKIVG